jgi:hypothetical protein
MVIVMLALRGSLELFAAPKLQEPGGPDVPFDVDDGEGPGGRDDDWVTLGTYWSTVEAHIARLKLEAEDIDCLIFDENFANHQLFAIAGGGVKLMVLLADADRARAILDAAAAADLEKLADDAVGPRVDESRPRWWAWPLVPVALAPLLLLGPLGLAAMLLGTAAGCAYLLHRP